jgi:hypothetical protein
MTQTHHAYLTDSPNRRRVGDDVTRKKAKSPRFNQTLSSPSGTKPAIW